MASALIVGWADELGGVHHVESAPFRTYEECTFAAYILVECGAKPFRYWFCSDGAEVSIYDFEIEKAQPSEHVLDSIHDRILLESRSRAN